MTENSPSDAPAATTPEEPTPKNTETVENSPAGPVAVEADVVTQSEPPPPVVDPVAVVAAERDKVKDQLLRTLADFDNYRKRSVRERQDEYRKGKEDVLRELLPVFDNLERASNYARTGADTKAVADGVQMVLRLFDDTLVRLGGTRLKSLGQPFDPNLHEAIQQVESAEHAAGTVALELVAGYQLGDRLLRPAMVAVSKGAPAAPETQN